MNLIKIFKNADFGNIRTTVVNNIAYFSLKDICKILEIKSVSECRSRLSEHGIQLIEVTDDKDCEEAGQHKKMIFISENLLSSVFFQSTKPEAEIFMDWIFRVVLPQIRKYGDYHVDDLRDPERAVEVLSELEDCKTKINVLQTNIEMNSYKLDYIEKVVGSKHCYDIEALPKLIKFKGISMMEILKILRTNGVFSSNNEPNQQYIDLKYFRIVEATAYDKTSTIIVRRTYVYQSGLNFIEKLLKKYMGVKNG